jgi:hypothetical protein
MLKGFCLDAAINQKAKRANFTKAAGIVGQDESFTLEPADATSSSLNV